MSNEDRQIIDEFLMQLADCTNKIDYIAEQEDINGERPTNAISIIRDYNAKIVELANGFNEWLMRKGKEPEIVSNL